MSACARFHDSLGAFHDGELGEPQAGELARHLPQCAECRAELARLEWLDGALRALPRSAPSEQLAEQLRARVAALGPRRSRRLERGAGRWAVAALCAAALALLFLRGGEERLSREDWQLLAEADTFELLLSEDPELLSEDPELLLALDFLERWND
jgi:anti-sigma factor RsiW